MRQEAAGQDFNEHFQFSKPSCLVPVSATDPNGLPCCRIYGLRKGGRVALRRALGSRADVARDGWRAEPLRREARKSKKQDVEVSNWGLRWVFSMAFVTLQEQTSCDAIDGAQGVRYPLLERPRGRRGAAPWHQVPIRKPVAQVINIRRPSLLFLCRCLTFMLITYSILFIPMPYIHVHVQNVLLRPFPLSASHSLLTPSSPIRNESGIRIVLASASPFTLSTTPLVSSTTCPATTGGHSKPPSLRSRPPPCLTFPSCNIISCTHTFASCFLAPDTQRSKLKLLLSPVFPTASFTRSLSHCLLWKTNPPRSTGRYHSEHLKTARALSSDLSLLNLRARYIKYRLSAEPSRANMLPVTPRPVASTGKGARQREYRHIRSAVRRPPGSAQGTILKPPRA